MQDLLSDLRLADSFFGLETGIDEEILADEEAVVLISVVLSWQMEAFVTLSQVSTSWKSVLFIWTMRKGLPRFCSSFVRC